MEREGGTEETQFTQMLICHLPALKKTTTRAELISVNT